MFAREPERKPHGMRIRMRIGFWQCEDATAPCYCHIGWVTLCIALLGGSGRTYLSTRECLFICVQVMFLQLQFITFHSTSHMRSSVAVTRVLLVDKRSALPAAVASVCGIMLCVVCLSDRYSQHTAAKQVNSI